MDNFIDPKILIDYANAANKMAENLKINLPKLMKSVDKNDVEGMNKIKEAQNKMNELFPEMADVMEKFNKTRENFE